MHQFSTCKLQADWFSQGQVGFSTADRIQAVKRGRRDGKKERDAVNDTKLYGIVSDQGTFEKRLFLHAKHTGAWMSIRVATVTGTVISATEFCDFYVLVTMLTP